MGLFISNQWRGHASQGYAEVDDELRVVSNLKINTDKFTVDAATGNTTVAGTLSVTAGGASITGNSSVTGTLGVSSDLAINTNKFNVDGTNGNTTVAGTLGSAGDFSVATNKFTVDAATGNTTLAGDAVLALGASGTAATTLATASNSNGLIASLQTSGNDFIIRNDVGSTSLYGNAYRVLIGTGGAWFAAGDNIQDLGIASLRWATVYAGTGTINTSDEREKQDILPIDDACMDAGDEIEFITHRWIDAVQKKGEDEARIHFGVIAQQVKQAFENHGLDGFRYGMLCYDEWDDEFETQVDTITYKIVTTEQQGEDAEGNPIMVKVESDPITVTIDNPNEEFKLPDGGVKISETTKEVKVLDAGNRYGVRYSQLACLKLACMDRKQKQLEARIATLESA